MIYYLHKIKKNENINIIISKSILFSLFILHVNAFTNDELFFKKIFSKEKLDKFNFTYCLISIIFI